jgi:hypothetical protein
MAVLALAAGGCGNPGVPVREFTGVVTFHLVPARVLRVNRIEDHPEPGTSYIGDEGLLVEVEENPDVTANWTVVSIEYVKYDERKTIAYDIMSERHEISVDYRAVRVEVAGDLSDYIEDD